MAGLAAGPVVKTLGVAVVQTSAAGGVDDHGLDLSPEATSMRIMLRCSGASQAFPQATRATITGRRERPIPVHRPRLPPIAISRYLTAHTVRDPAAALAASRARRHGDRRVQTHRGHAEIGQWLTGAASAYTYTTELLGAQRTDADHWLVTQRLEGDFPGGVVDLRFQFSLGGGLIERLAIGV